MKKEIKDNVRHLQLANSVQNLMKVVNTLMNSMAEVRKDMETLEDSYIIVLNRLNEVELSIETHRTALAKDNDYADSQ